MRFLLLFLLIIPGYSRGQNLVINGGFESYANLPGTYGEWYLCNGWDNCGGSASPDYFHMAGISLPYFGTNLPHTDSAMAGICTFHGNQPEFREYLSSSLTPPMVTGFTYTVSFWIASGINGGYSSGSNNLGVYFSNGPLLQSGSLHIPVIPQFEDSTIFYDTSWTQITFQFFADSAYDRLTIGNFKDDLSTQTFQFGTAINAAYVYLDDVSVVNAQVTALFTGDHHVCPGTCTDFTNLSQNATSYLWSFPGGTPSTSTDVNPSVCYYTPGNYDVSLIASNASSSDTTLLPNYITVYPYSPALSIQQVGDTLFASMGFTAYQWFYQGDTIPGATDYYYVAPQSGDYSVICEDGNGCSSEGVVLNVIASVEEPVAEETILIFPNPVTEEFTMQDAQFRIKTAESISIYNVVGECIFLTVDCELPSVDCRLFSPGLYLAEIKSGNVLYKTKFIKQ